MVDVTGVDRDELLYALWSNSKPAAFFSFIPHNITLIAPHFEYPSQEQKSYSDGYIDYHCGRLIKSNVYTKRNVIDPTLYDRDYGKGAFQTIVNQLK